MTGSQPSWNATIARFLELALVGDVRASTRLVVDLLDEGTDFETIVLRVLAASQVVVGERWVADQCSVADEHLATHATQRALDALSHTFAMPAPNGLVLVACADKEWHSLPAQMFAELLRARGVGVMFLGPSTSAEHVARLMTRTAPDALVVSCSMPVNLPGVAMLARVAHRHAVPVLAGGRGTGLAPRHGLALGADACAHGIEDGLPVLLQWISQAPKRCAARTRVLPAPRR